MRMISLTFAAILFAFGATAGASADEWEENTPYYEDDAWYDVTEWFDGNGQELTFTGVPVKVKDRRFVMAQTVQHDGETMQIDRTRKTSKQ